MRNKTIQELTILDDFMFGAVMMEPENCKGLLERILEIPIDRVEIDQEKSLRYHPEYKGVRLDVLAKDDKGTRYNIEMQVKKTPIEKRSRYYHAQMDMDLLLRGETYEDLPECYVIFICDYDPMEGKKYRYTIGSHCSEMPEKKITDGVHTIILSNRGENPKDVPQELVSFLEYTRIATSEDNVASDDILINQMQESIRRIKSSREMGERYMKLELLMAEERREGRKEGREEGREEGIQEGLQKGRESLVFELVRDGLVSPESAAMKLSCSLEDFQEKMDAYFQKPHEEDY